jgi:hypothetical protein
VPNAAKRKLSATGVKQPAASDAAKRQKKEGGQDDECNKKLHLDLGIHPKNALRHTPVGAAVGHGLAELICNAYDGAASHNCPPATGSGKGGTTVADGVTVLVTVDGTEVDCESMGFHDEAARFEMSREVVIKITNVCGTRKGPDHLRKLLEFQHFRRKPIDDTRTDPRSTGKFGTGLKDAIADFLWFGITYTAASGYNVFTVAPRLSPHGTVCVLRAPQNSSAVAVTQTVTWTQAAAAVADHPLTAQQVLCHLRDGLGSSWPWLVRSKLLHVVYSGPSGSVAKWARPEMASNGHVFVNQKRYVASHTRGTIFAYNVRMRKELIHSAVQPPHGWGAKAATLFKLVDFDVAMGRYWTTEFFKNPEFLEPTRTDTRSWYSAKTLQAHEHAVEQAAHSHKALAARDAAERRLEQAKAAAVSFTSDSLSEGSGSLGLEPAADPALDSAQSKLRAARAACAGVTRRVPPLPLVRAGPGELVGPHATAMFDPADRPLNNPKMLLRMGRLPRAGDPVGETEADRHVRAALAPVCAAIPGRVVIVGTGAALAATAAGAKAGGETQPSDSGGGGQPAAVAARWNAFPACLEVESAASMSDRQPRLEAALGALARDCPTPLHRLLSTALLAVSSGAPHTITPPAVMPAVTLPNITPHVTFRPMLIIDDWGSATGGIAAFNYQLAQAWAELEHTEVYVLITEREAMPPLWLRPARINFVAGWGGGRLGVGLFAERAATITTLVGHAAVSGPRMLAVAAQPEFAHCQKWLVMHTTPGWVDPWKGCGREEKVEQKDDGLVRVALQCDLVLPVGEYINGYWSKKLSAATRAAAAAAAAVPRAGGRPVQPRASLPRPQPRFHTFVPQLNPFFFMEAPAVGHRPLTDFTMCSIGRTDGVLHAKGVDMLMDVCDAVDKRVVKPVLIIRGLKGSLATARVTLGVGERTSTRVECRGYGDHDAVKSDLGEANLFLMTSRVEPFGLSGLEALAAGVVPLVIETSGLAMHLRQYCGELAEQLVVPARDSHAEQVDAWRQRVHQVIATRATLPALAKQIVAKLRAVPNSPQDLADLELERLGRLAHDAAPRGAPPRRHTSAGACSEPQ